MQILENLLTNAAKYTEDRGQVGLTLERDGDRALIRVTDNGLGIEPAMLHRIFDLFVQDARSVDRSQGGLGIGLALVRHLVEAHGGEIHAFSDGRGKGSQIVLRLRLLPQSAVPVPVERPADTENGSGRVLIVDDDVDAGESMEVLLGMYGYQVERAVDLNSALAAARRLRPHVIILDLALPGADGYEIARRLRALPEVDDNARYLSLSGFGQPHDFNRSREAGFAKHLVKPMDPAELDRLLKTLLKEDRDSAGAEHGE
jgi:two-component system CheB/CheR fusion protein